MISLAIEAQMMAWLRAISSGERNPYILAAIPSAKELVSRGFGKHLPETL
jgi:hypothetical protein